MQELKNLRIERFPSGPFSTNAYIVMCKESHHAAIIDPAPHSYRKLVDASRTMNAHVDMILLTHSHWDHIADVYPLIHWLDLPLYVHSEDKENVEHPGVDGVPMWLPIEGITPTRLLQEGENIQIGMSSWRVLHTPGHSPGSVCFYNSEEKVLLSGDTLFRGTIGSLSLPTAQPERMWNSLAKLKELPDETLVLPGHGATTTIGNEEWLSNPKARFSEE